ncbi:c-type cytochrome [Sulfitobacter aestuarii]|uniref:C-type cytochrome n=1 Tax=Sulfitobacter aestuarii TaxID=2161676 RepID=A0ABW5TXS5_9RHOB
MKWGTIIALLIAAAALIFYLTQDRSGGPNNAGVAETPLPEGALVAVTLPASLSDQEKMGERAYDATCATCHGANAQGQDGIAPPLVHKIYEPSHHGDMAFLVAAKNGVRAHHWNFGNMPPIEGITQAEVRDIVAYVRALQRANGIE